VRSIGDAVTCSAVLVSSSTHLLCDNARLHLYFILIREILLERFIFVNNSGGYPLRMQLISGNISALTTKFEVKHRASRLLRSVIECSSAEELNFADQV
jgi:hypothetical protein